MKQKEFNHKFAETVRSFGKDSDLIAEIKDSVRLPAERALEVYQEDYQARLTEALQNTYRGIHALIGEDDFFRLALDYIKMHASPFSDLDDYGHRFSEFLLKHPINEEYQFLSELAHFEWNFREIFHLPEFPGIKAFELQQFFQENASRVQLVNSARLFHYSFMVDQLYALKEAEALPENFNFNQEQYLLMYKSGVMVKIHALSKNQWEFLKNFITPESLLNAIEKAQTIMSPAETESLFLILGREPILSKSN